MTEYPVRCKTCKKRSRNCTCFEFRLEPEGRQEGQAAYVFVDNVARDPVRGENVRTWQPRRNARIWRWPTFEDGYGPILMISSGDQSDEIYEQVKAEIESGEFRFENWEGKSGVNTRKFEKELKHLPFLRKPRVSPRRVAVKKSLAEKA